MKLEDGDINPARVGMSPTAASLQGCRRRSKPIQTTPERALAGPASLKGRLRATNRSHTRRGSGGAKARKAESQGGNCSINVT